MKWYFILFFVGFHSLLFAQTTMVQGLVLDSITNEALIGATVFVSSTKGTKTNQEGRFQLDVSPGVYTLTCSLIGYNEYKRTIRVDDQFDLQTIYLSSKKSELNTITISGSRFAKLRSEEIVSMEVVKPSQVLNLANNSMDDALQRVPGVDVIENQVNIRGGSGWSYGAGSRVLILVDDMPMLTADAGDAKWDFLPIENCEQIEILKGASSALYGSSALNGVLNFRTAYAKKKPITNVLLYNGVFGNPKNKDWKWWGKQQPSFQGGYAMHAQKYKQLDAVFGAAWYSEDSYLQGDLSRRFRTNVNLRYRSKKIEGLHLGLNTNLQWSKSQNFFFWQPDSNGITAKYYQPYGGLEDATTTINKNQGQRLNIDPSISYITKNNTKHVLRTRWFRSKNDIPEKNQSSKADTYFGEYQFQKTIHSKSPLLHQLNIVSGVMMNYNNVLGELYGNHHVLNIAPYMQIEKKWNKLWTSIGGRYESYRLDKTQNENKPVFRAGANYEVNTSTFLRASCGQGYRFPSIAERFVRTSFGASQVFPNIELKAETGWSSEIGIKQFYQLGSWKGFIDIAAFWMQYRDMMEFNFGLYLPRDSTLSQVNDPQDYLGFKSINVGNTRINGLDMSMMGIGSIGPIQSTAIIGVTLMNPTLINPDSAILVNISGNSKTLKYRYRRSIKVDVENQYKRITLGTTILYNSFMQSIDEVFANTKPDENPFGTIFQLGTGLPSTVTDFRNKYNKGTFIWDARIALAITKQIRLALIAKNVLNTVYAERPALVSPPRNFTLQLGIKME